MTTLLTRRAGRESDPDVTDDDGPGEVVRLPAWVRHVGWVLLGLQLVVILAFSTAQYRRYSLTGDFADYSQAWWGILHGHLDPYISGLGVPYWKINAEFLMWPIAFLSHLYPHPIVLLLVQDIAIVLTEVVAFGWVRRAIERAGDNLPRRVGPWLALGAAVVLVINPWVYETIGYAFHFEPIVGLFCVLVGYNLWAGRIRRLWLWVPMVLLTTSLGGIYLVGLGISGMLAGRRTRRPGAVIAVVGAAWAMFFIGIGAAGGNSQFVDSSYSYLVGPHHHGRIGVLAIVVGALGHPGAAAHVAADHLWIVLVFLIAFGIVGVLSPWGFGMGFAVLVPNLLDHSGDFISLSSAFQSWPAMPFVLVGTILVLIRLIKGGTVGRKVATVAVLVWATLVLELAVIALPAYGREWIRIDPQQATELSRISTMIPANAEVIASQNVVGRFAQRESVYAIGTVDETFPVTRHRVFVILVPLPGVSLVDVHGTEADVRYVRTRLHARVLDWRSNVYAFAWSPPPGTVRVTLP